MVIVTGCQSLWARLRTRLLGQIKSQLAANCIRLLDWSSRALEADLVDGQGSSVSTIYTQEHGGERATYVDGVPNGGGVEVVDVPMGF